MQIINYLYLSLKNYQAKLLFTNPNELTHKILVQKKIVLQLHKILKCN